MKTLRIIVCALLCVAFCASAAVAAGTPDFYGFTLGMTREQSDAKAKKQGFEPEEQRPNFATYRGTVFGVPERLLVVEYKDGKLEGITIYLWGKFNDPKNGLSNKALEAKEKELLTAFTKKYGKYTFQENDDTDDTTSTFWNLSGENTVLLITGGNDDRTRAITVFFFRRDTQD